MVGILEGGVHTRPVGVVITLLTRLDAAIMRMYAPTCIRDFNQGMRYVYYYVVKNHNCNLLHHNMAHS